MNDLEHMSKRASVVLPVHVTTTETQKLVRDCVLPKRMKEESFYFGKSSGCYEPGAQRINDVINNVYSKDFLKETIVSRTIESIKNKQRKEYDHKDIHNKTSKLRS